MPPTPVKEVTIAGRLRRFIENGGIISDEVLDECFYMDPKDFQTKYGKRVTWVETEEGKQSAERLYSNYASQDGVTSYPVFRTRLKSLERRNSPITRAQVAKAAISSQADWITDYGGGRRKGFTYDGDLYPEHRGQYSAFTSFLKAIGRYDEREMMHARLKAKWAIDDMLAEPPMSNGAPGYIYKITDETTGKAYVGLTVNRPEIRLGQHLVMANRGGGSPLHQAMRIGGSRSFAIEVLEVVEGGERRLAEREIEWIMTLDTLHPNGLNSRAGGQIGSYDGRPVEWDGRRFRSIASMRRILCKETGLAEHIIESRFRKGKPLPSRVRKHSKYADAGTPLFRQHLGILKRAREKGDDIDPAWLDYDRFKADVTRNPGEGRLTRIDEERPWGPDNWTWMEHKAIVERSHGKAIEAFGRTWATLEQALTEFGIGGGTYHLRIKAGMSVEDALSTPIGPTSKKEFTFEGETWPSRNRACIELAARHGTTPDKVKDRLVRGIPLSRWKQMDSKRWPV
ncbi:GIY-YIG nuclease family protein [Sinorhizobium meliloti]|uniref:GIY-YIG nuclease family protein n=1 Tax=Rhizobium meliloti TaxID=382 RepID=UPI003F5CD788